LDLLSRLRKEGAKVAEASPRIRVASEIASEPAVRVADPLDDTAEQAPPPKPALAARA